MADIIRKVQLIIVTAWLCGVLAISLSAEGKTTPCYSISLS